jgi:cell division protein FtsB
MNRTRQEWNDTVGAVYYEILADWQASDDRKCAEIKALRAENKELVEQVKKLKGMLVILEPGSPFL